MKPVAMGILEDLRQRRLLPVAALLIVALVALPVLVLKPAPAAPQATPVPTSGASSTGGLPTPSQALSSDKPLVTLAVLEQASNLDQYSQKDPFKPLQAVRNPTSSAATVAKATAAGSGSSGSAATGGGSPSTGSAGGGSNTTSGGTTPTPTPTTTTPAKPKTVTKQLTYALDVSVTTTQGTRRYRNLSKLSQLPSTNDPRLIFLGVKDGGTQVVFLVDAGLKAVVGGEGTCTPSGDQCATLTIEPGQRQSFSAANGQQLTIQVDEVRQVSVASAAKASRLLASRVRSAANTAAGPAPRRFELPVLTDLFVTGP